ncbi:zinc finger protein 488 isoform X1 [Canis lupus baileyi]|uniref:zinc finger protein 488 isoform X1 n=2 Tax=Canis lupus baileyi TaxID=143281 RepID=UPI003B975C1D
MGMEGSRRSRRFIVLRPRWGWPSLQGTQPPAPARGGRPTTPSPEARRSSEYPPRQLAPTLPVGMAAGKGTPRSASADDRWQLSEAEPGRGGKPVLLEKTNHLHPEATAGNGGQDEAHADLLLPATPGKLGLGGPMAWACCEQGPSAFTEVPRLKKRPEGVQAQERGHANPKGHPGPRQLPRDLPRSPAGSKGSVWPRGAPGEQRSAFRTPARCPAGGPSPASVFQAGGPTGALGELLGLINTVDVPGWGQLSNPKLLVGDFWGLQTLPQNALVCSAFLGAPTLWLKRAPARTPAASSSSSAASRALLPPTFASLGLSTQNWCAKCNLSFRLTSDLVFHMRSHHKKERASPDPSSKKLREEAFMCPICHEYFQERHHLSRHMTSHS